MLPGASLRLDDGAARATIRAVTPEQAAGNVGGTADTVRLRTVPLSMSPTVAYQDRERENGLPRYDPSAVDVSDDSEDEYGVKYVRDPPFSRSRSRMLDDRPRQDRSPVSSSSRSGYKRIGGTSSAAASATGDRPVASIGHPSIIPAPFAAHPGQNSTTSPVSSRSRFSSVGSSDEQSAARQAGTHRPQSSSTATTVHALTPIPSPAPAPAPASAAGTAPVPAAASASASASATASSRTPPRANMSTAGPSGRRILRLMEECCGEMEGMAAFRKTEACKWTVKNCCIDKDTGRLYSETRGDSPGQKILIPDLRGCQVRFVFEPESRLPVLDIHCARRFATLQLRPPTQPELESWCAALLCWQPIRPGGARNKAIKPLPQVTIERKASESRRHSDATTPRESPIIKVGNMILWDRGMSLLKSKSSGQKKPVFSRARRWRRVQCRLRENGDLKLISESEKPLIVLISISQLSRSAVQPLDPSVLEQDFSIAIYPHFSRAAQAPLHFDPLFLSFESRILYETWIVLLTAFTLPDLYGPPVREVDDGGGANVGKKLRPLSMSTSNLFRIERTVSARAVEARLNGPSSARAPESPRVTDTFSRDRQPTLTSAMSAASICRAAYYVEIALDGEIRAKTTLNDEGSKISWIEEFRISQVQANLSTLSFILKERQLDGPPSERRAGASVRDEILRSPSWASLSQSPAGYSEAYLDTSVGRADILLPEIPLSGDKTMWWPLLNVQGHEVGEVLVKVRIDETVVLPVEEYKPLWDLLQRLENGVTLQMVQTAPYQLKQLSSLLLDLYQVHNMAADWIIALSEEEVDGITKGQPVSELRYSKRTASVDQGGELVTSSTTIDRELMVRDMGKSATVEVNLLFRSNTLLTKALDLHMQRIGKEYLHETLSGVINEILEIDPSCEVDVRRGASQADVDKNWRRLLKYTGMVWAAIRGSALNCPEELRYILRHIRAFADDRYGQFLRTVPYSSVSGFLFLRFFGPAVLNPQLYGLLKVTPRPNVRRTLTLIAKSLQVLANLNTLGLKEGFMEPMNPFIKAHRQEFKDYIDEVTAVASERSSTAFIHPSYSTPLQIQSRMPSTSREGWLSLPYMLDKGSCFANLIARWVDANSAEKVQERQESKIQEAGGDMRRFHDLCQELRQRAERCAEEAEAAERPSLGLLPQWHSVVEKLEQSAPLDGVARIEVGPHRSRYGFSGPYPPSASSPSTLAGATVGSAMASALQGPAGQAHSTGWTSPQQQQHMNSGGEENLSDGYVSGGGGGRGGWYGGGGGSSSGNGMAGSSRTVPRRGGGRGDDEDAEDDYYYYNSESGRDADRP